VIERARAAARAQTERDAGSRPHPAPRPSDDGVLQALSFGRAQKKPGGPAGALMVAGALTVAGVASGGYVFLEGNPSGKATLPTAAPAVSAQASPSAGPVAAVALTPSGLGASPPAADLSVPYSAAVAKIEAGESGGLTALRKLADQGYAPAQFYLGEAYQDGKAGMKKDPVLSRQWLERAAEGGDRTAMHNLALDYHDGVGGPRNAAVAAEWFRRAADLGLLDSQFNLAAIYEHGDGVSQNLAEAYKWYLIAARTGDAGSKAAATRVAGELTPEARAVAERAAAEFQPAPPAASAAAGPPSSALVTAQRALNQLGYYQGPTDGQSSPALRLALAAYQRDQSLPVTGAADAATVAKLQVYTQ
ncbi:MAG: SEL1-like repeat protein, partial [Caulobacteraceae bacterium]